MTVSPAAANTFPAAVAEVAEVEETGEIPTAVDGTPGKTIKDFVKSFSFEQGTGKTYATMVKGDGGLRRENSPGDWWARRGRQEHAEDWPGHD